MYRMLGSRFRKRTATPVERHGKVYFDHHGLCSEWGRPIVFRGVSLFWSQWKPQFFNGNVVRWLSEDWKIDVIRIPIAATDPGFLSDPAGETAKAMAVIDAAIRCGIYALVDWHGYDPATDSAILFFETIARRYRDVANVMYELWNEPAQHFSWTEIARHHERTLSTIRAISPSAPAVLGTTDFCTGLLEAAGSRPGVANVAYALHFYAATHRQGLRNQVDAAVKLGLPIFVSEWGIGDSSGDGFSDPDEASRWLDFLNCRSISHINWSINDKPEVCSALRRNAAATGGWRRWSLTESGRFARAYLRQAATASSDA